ncbi:hypothetical protein M422DRAFT_55790 [Sphaerobolus stellatus SS14]|uniref:Uncharacterized protein n=1 Tax=Sphaerobolus stellatus (strain SS14) TaxID=990650 RepID=A0A0C9TVJ6_SPHS4|nr:hypothetical protein M422DRAFT_55790 [Sphaerobolus stellatus SS14]
MVIMEYCLVDDAWAGDLAYQKRQYERSTSASLASPLCLSPPMPQRQHSPGDILTCHYRKQASKIVCPGTSFLIGHASGIVLSGYQVVADLIWSPLRTFHQPSASTSASVLVTVPNSITEYIPILPTYQVADNTPPYLVQRSSPSNASASAPTMVLIGHIVRLHILLYQIAGSTLFITMSVNSVVPDLVNTYASPNLLPTEIATESLGPQDLMKRRLLPSHH